MLKKYKHALLFLLRYVVVYLALNTAYAFYIERYAPQADPITVIAAMHSAKLLAMFDSKISYAVISGKQNVPIRLADETIIEVYEGCNSINVMLVFLSFIIAFQGSKKLYFKFIPISVVLIYVFNLLRIIGLYVVAIQFPEALYFLHKFLFTGIIYMLVFALWYWWISSVRRLKTVAQDS